MSSPDTTWFLNDRFGMFIHFGLYALPARHEWSMTWEKRTVEDYEGYSEFFDPDLFDARDWARKARQAGMKYVVLTTKHHEGFCLWDSALTDYKSTNTPFGRDLVAEYVDALREEGVRVGFYHSLIDWHHPDFTIDGHHPQRDAENAATLNTTRDMNRYREYLHGQVRELLTNYGQIDYLFFDFSYELEPHSVWGGKGSDDWASQDLLALVRGLQPNIIVNDRLAIDGDFVTPEQYQPDKPMKNDDGAPVPWEACQTLNGSWGYDRDNLAYKSPDLLVRMLVDGVSKNGNLLLNVGPTGRGEFDPRAVDTLQQIGEWMRLHERSIRGAGASDFPAPADARYTQRGNRLYLHLFTWPLEHVHLPGLADRVTYAQLLNDASEVQQIRADPGLKPLATEMGGQPAGTLTLKLPIRQPEVLVPVVELFLKD